MNLDSKIKQSIETIQKAESLALKYQDFGFHLAFSGGKDSQVIYELCKMAGVKFKAFFYKTSVDPKEILSFIRQNYPDVEWIRPKMTMYQLILKKGMLPLRQCRFCCEYLKERNGLNAVVITGITKAESAKRKKRKSFEQSCKTGQDKNLLNPILEWTKREVLQFLKDRNIEISNLYLKQDRIGCIGCPMSPKAMRRDFRDYPNNKKAYINTVAKLMKEKGKYPEFESAEDVVDWWASGLSRAVWMANKTQYKLYAEPENITNNTNYMQTENITNNTNYMQNRRTSLFESLTNTFIGMGISFIIQLILFPIMNIPVKIEQNIIIMFIFTGASIGRTYVIRRIFNRKNK